MVCNVGLQLQCAMYILRGGRGGGVHFAPIAVSQEAGEVGVQFVQDGGGGAQVYKCANVHSVSVHNCVQFAQSAASKGGVQSAASLEGEVGAQV